VPATEELALSCAPLSAVPKVIAAGVDHVMEDAAWFTASETEAVAVE
jgi:hypothetical protein